MSKTKYNSPIDVMEHITRQSTQGNLILFCGAGISIKEPSSLPSVDVIVRSVIENLSETVPELGDEILSGYHIFQTSPFELFMSVIQQGLKFRVFEILEPLLGGTPNSIHHYVTKLLLEKKIRSLVTTNFDDMLETALGHRISEISFYYSWQEVHELKDNLSKPSIIKPHGSFFDKSNNDIASSTILTTTESIFKSSREFVLKEWAKLFSGSTIVFLGYSGRDRLDVIPLLSFLTNSDIIWVCHNNDQELKLPTEIDDIVSKEIKTLIESGTNITPVSGHTEKFLSVLGTNIGIDYDESYSESNSKRHNSFAAFKKAGFLPPVYPKYSYLVAGYLLLWLGFARQAGYAFSECIKQFEDSEPRLSNDSSLALGQVFERMGELSNSETSYRIALSRYWGLGDYPSIIKTQCYYADLLMTMDQYDEAERLIINSIRLCEREKYEDGLGLAFYMKGKHLELIGDWYEAISSYSDAIKFSESMGDFWVEAGNRQKLVEVQHLLNGLYTAESIEQIIISLNKIYWLGNGSAPSLKAASFADPFFLSESLIDSLLEVKGEQAVPYLEANEMFSRFSDRLPTDINIRVKQKLGFKLS